MNPQVFQVDPDEIEFLETGPDSFICTQFNPLSCIQLRSSSAFLPKSVIAASRAYTSPSINSPKVRLNVLNHPNELANFTYGLISELDRVSYGAALSRYDPILIGYVIHHASLALIRTRKPSKTREEQAAQPLLKELEAERQAQIAAFETELDSIPCQSDILGKYAQQVRLLGSGNRKYSQVRPILHTITNKIYRDLSARIRSGALQIDPGVRVLARIVYMRVLPGIDLGNEAHLLFYHRWRSGNSKTAGKVAPSISELEQYLRLAPVDHLQDDVIYLLKNFGKAEREK